MFTPLSRRFKKSERSAAALFPMSRSVLIWIAAGVCLTGRSLPGNGVVATTSTVAEAAPMAMVMGRDTGVLGSTSTSNDCPANPAMERYNRYRPNGTGAKVYDPRASVSNGRTTPVPRLCSVPEACMPAPDGSTTSTRISPEGRWAYEAAGQPSPTTTHVIDSTRQVTPAPLLGWCKDTQPKRPRCRGGTGGQLLEVVETQLVRHHDVR